MTADRFAVFAGLYAGVAFGIFWLPLRAVEEAGFQGPWAMVLFAGCPFLLCLPIIWRNRTDYFGGPSRHLLGGVLGGLAFALYGTAFLYTDVVHVIVLFYVMPVWGFLLGWVMMGDKITWYRWLAVAFGFIGIFIIFGYETGLPVPRNLGDWCALVSGMVWAVASLLILMHRRVRVSTHGVNFFATAAIASVIVAMIAGAQDLVPAPDWSQIGSLAIWVVPVALILILPAGMAAVFAPSRLNPGVCGLLFMTEVAVGAATAAIWANEPMGFRELTGLILILAAGLVEPVAMTLSRQQTA